MWYEELRKKYEISKFCCDYLPEYYRYYSDIMGLKIVHNHSIPAYATKFVFEEDPLVEYEEKDIPMARWMKWGKDVPDETRPITFQIEDSPSFLKHISMP